MPNILQITKDNQNDWYNLKNSSKLKLPNWQSWINYWWDNGGSKSNGQCCVYGHTADLKDGAHIVKKNCKTVYIAPFCLCNRAKGQDEMTLNVGTVLVKAPMKGDILVEVPEDGFTVVWDGCIPYLEEL